MIKGNNVGDSADFVATVVAGEGLAQNDAVYIKASDGKAYKCDADDSTKIGFVGFAQEAALIGANVVIVLDGLHNTFSGLTPASTYYLSGTAGLITTTPPAAFQVIVGTAITATVLKIQASAPTFIADIDTTDASLLNSTTETTVYTKAFAAGSFSTFSMLKILANCSVLWEKLTGPVVTVRVKLNGTTVASLAMSSAAPGGGTTDVTYSGFWEALMINNASLAAQKTLMNAMLIAQINDDSALTQATSFVTDSENTSAVDTAGAVTLTITYQSGAAVSGAGWSHRNVRVEKIA